MLSVKQGLSRRKVVEFALPPMDLNANGEAMLENGGCATGGIDHQRIEKQMFTVPVANGFKMVGG